MAPLICLGLCSFRAYGCAADVFFYWWTTCSAAFVDGQEHVCENVPYLAAANNVVVLSNASVRMRAPSVRIVDD